MKAIKKLVLFILVGSTAANFGCTKDEMQDPPVLNVTTSTTTAKPGDMIDIAITTSSAGLVETLKISEKTQGSSVPGVLLDSTVHQANYGFTYHYTVPQNATAPVDVIVTATDDKAQTTTKTVTISITGTATIKSCDNMVLGSYDNTTGSFFSSKTCDIYTVGEAKNNQSAVDFIYFYGATNHATLAAPNDADANTISTFELNTWSTKNATTFKMASSFDFGGATVASIMTAWNAGGSELTKASELSNGQVYVFKTADNRYGAIKVNSITAGANGTINIDVKSTM